MEEQQNNFNEDSYNRLFSQIERTEAQKKLKEIDNINFIAFQNNLPISSEEEIDFSIRA